MEVPVANGANLVIRGLELLVLSPKGGERAWTLTQLPMANDLINIMYVMKIL